MSIKAYKYRIYPTDEQKEFFAKTFGCVRKVYNLMLSERIKNYDIEKETGVKSKYPTPAKYKSEYSFLKEVDSLALANAQLNLQKAYVHFFRRIKEKNSKFGFPKYKNKHGTQSYTTNNQNGTVSIFEHNLLKLPKFKGYVKIKKHRDFIGLIKSATIEKTTSNKYYVSVLVQEPQKKVNKKSIEENKTIGIDLGIKQFLTISNGRNIENPKYLVSSLKKLKKEQRIFSRKKKGSISRDKQKIVVARTHEKVKNKRLDFLHKVSSEIVNDNQVTSIALENLYVKGMTKNRKLSRSINDVSWSLFIQLLSYKAEEKGKNIIKIDRFYPSSKTCGCCGHIKKDLTLKDRVWTCEKCGTELERDINAAKNIKQKALVDVLGTRMCVKSSPMTKLHDGSVIAKEEYNSILGSHEAQTIALA